MSAARHRLPAVLVGYGRIAAGYSEDEQTARHFRYATHAQVLEAHPAFDWRAVVDPSPAARERARSRGVPRVVASLGELPAAVEPAVAVIATPPARRLDVIEALPGSVKAVMVEKPLGESLADAEAFVAACARRRMLTQVNLWRRGDALTRGLAAGGLTERIGTPQAAFGVYGNGLLNNGVHMVDLVRMLLGEIADFRVAGPPARRGDGELPLDGDADAPLDLHLASGLHVPLRPLHFDHYRENALDLWGTRGRLSIMNEGLLVLHYPADAHRALEGAVEIATDRPETLAPTAGEALYRLYDNLAESLARHEPTWSPAEQALVSERIVHQTLETSGGGGRGLGRGPVVLDV